MTPDDPISDALRFRLRILALRGIADPISPVWVASVDLATRGESITAGWPAGSTRTVFPVARPAGFATKTLASLHLYNKTLAKERP